MDNRKFLEFTTPSGKVSTEVPGLDEFMGFKVISRVVREDGVEVIEVEDPFTGSAFDVGIRPEKIEFFIVEGKQSLVVSYPVGAGIGFHVGRFCDAALYGYRKGQISDPSSNCAIGLNYSHYTELNYLIRPNLKGQLVIEFELDRGVNGFTYSPEVGPRRELLGPGADDIPVYSVFSILNALRNDKFFFASSAENLGSLEVISFGLQGGMKPRPKLITGGSVTPNGGTFTQSAELGRGIDVNVVPMVLLAVMVIANATRKWWESKISRQKDNGKKSSSDVTQLSPVYQS